MTEPSGRRSSFWLRATPFLTGGAIGAGSLAAFALLPTQSANPQLLAVAAALVCGAMMSFSPLIVAGDADPWTPDATVRRFVFVELRRLSTCLLALAGAIAGLSVAAVALSVFQPAGLFFFGLHLLLFILLIALTMAGVSALSGGSSSASRLAGLFVWLIIWSMLFWSRPWIMNARATENAIETQHLILQTDADTLRLLDGRSKFERDEFISKRARATADANVRARRLSLSLEMMPYSIYPSFFRSTDEPIADTLMGGRTYDAWIGSFEKHAYPTIGSVFGRWLKLIALMAVFAGVALVASMSVRNRLRAYYTTNV
ncbi:MAG: hypothetical protein ABIH86_01795 [Planctomycetota bacterium]